MRRTDVSAVALVERRYVDLLRVASDGCRA